MWVSAERGTERAQRQNDRPGVRPPSTDVDWDCGKYTPRPGARAFVRTILCRVTLTRHTCNSYFILRLAMGRSMSRLFAGIAAVLLVSSSVFAHHGAASIYDMSKETTIKA